MNAYGEKARAYFLQGYNCSQAVLLAFGDRTGLDEKTAARMASSFGGGIGRMREVCGTVSGMLLAAGILLGYDDPRDLKAKSEHYAVVRELAGRFRSLHGSIICRELLSPADRTPGGEPAPRTPEYYQKRPCPELAASAAAILGDYLEEISSQNA